MKILKAIELADSLCPNPYSFEEKVCWCDEVSAELCRNVIKTYDIIESTLDSSGHIELPDGVDFNMVELIFIGNERFEKQDFRSLAARLTETDPGKFSGQKIRVVYLKVPKPTRLIDINGEFNTSENVIEIMFPPFREGDKIEIAQIPDGSNTADWDNSKVAYVMEASVDRIILDHDALEAQTDANLAIRRIITDHTVIDDPPYDRMYTEYLLAKMALYQHDYVGYNAHMTQYNSLFESARREYITRNPLTTQTRFKNYSIL